MVKEDLNSNNLVFIGAQVNTIYDRKVPPFGAFVGAANEPIDRVVVDLLQLALIITKNRTCILHTLGLIKFDSRNNLL